MAIGFFDQQVTPQRLAPYDLPATSEFTNMARAIRHFVISRHPDEAAAFAASVVPIWTMRDATPEMKKAGRCEHCRFLGLWAASWPGYDPEAHGHIWLFEDGIREQARRERIAVMDQIANTLVHELDHALERNHVLEHLRKAQTMAAQGVIDLYPEEYRVLRPIALPAAVPCG